MKPPHAELMAAYADKLEKRSECATDKDHPKWLKRIATALRQGINAKEKAFEHKESQRQHKRG